MHFDDTTPSSSNPKRYYSQDPLHPRVGNKSVGSAPGLGICFTTSGRASIA